MTEAILELAENFSGALRQSPALPGSGESAEGAAESHPKEALDQIKPSETRLNSIRPISNGSKSW